MRLLCVVALALRRVSVGGLLVDVAEGLVEQSMDVFEELDLMGIGANPGRDNLVRFLMALQLGKIFYHLLLTAPTWNLRHSSSGWIQAETWTQLGTCLFEFIRRRTK
jgi:hypothetical protein